MRAHGPSSGLVVVAAVGLLSLVLGCSDATSPPVLSSGAGPRAQFAEVGSQACHLGPPPEEPEGGCFV